MPRAAAVRQDISHLAHHRGPMTVYLQLRDVPVPSVRGPKVDEGWQGRVGAGSTTEVER